MSRNVFKGVSFDGVHSYNDLGLYLSEYPEFDMPDIQTSWVEVPGRDGKLNLTKALDGYTHYNNRSCSLKFLFVGTKAEGMAAYSRLGNLLHGQQFSEVIFDEDNCYYYVGQFEVGSADYGSFRTKISVSGELEPYKYEINAVGDDWLWDAIDFEAGTIKDLDNYTYSVDSTTLKAFTITTSSKPQIPTIRVYAANNLHIRNRLPTTGTEIALTNYSGDTYYDVKSPYFMLCGDNTFQMRGTGTIALIWHGGEL